MHIIYLAGNWHGNRDWIEGVKRRFDTFSTGQILYYGHWQSGGRMIDWEKEAKKLGELVKDRDDYFVFAKSVGTILALKTIDQGVFKPKKAIFCGIPYHLAQRGGILVIPTIFIQNEFDPACSHEKLNQALQKNKPMDYQLIKNPDNNTHSYEDYEQLVNLAKKFFVK